jgi:hypothetical protein
MTPRTGTHLFTVPPRRGRAAPLVVALWAILALAFLVEVAPVRAPEERLYELYASADAYARSAAAAAARQHAAAVASDGTARGPVVLADASHRRPAPAAALIPDTPRECSCP